MPGLSPDYRTIVQFCFISLRDLYSLKEPGPSGTRFLSRLEPFGYNGRACAVDNSICGSFVMGVLSSLHRNPARAFFFLLWGGLCCLLVGAPLVSARSPSLSAFIYLFFAPVCHQRPERSFILLGHTLAVCERCTGLYFGLFLGSLLPFNGRRLFSDPIRRRVWVLASAAPMIFDALAPRLGIWTNSAGSRFATGLFFGAMVTPLLVYGVEELLVGFSLKRLHFRSSQIKGDIS